MQAAQGEHACNGEADREPAERGPPRTQPRGALEPRACAGHHLAPALVRLLGAARERGATHCGLVSALGASARSTVFYNRGVVWQVHQEFGKAIADYTEAIRLAESYKKSHVALVLGGALGEEGERALNRVVEIGHIWFGSALQRTPGATEAIYLLSRHAFEELHVRRLEWKCDAANERSRRALCSAWLTPVRSAAADRR